MWQEWGGWYEYRAQLCDRSGEGTMLFVCAGLCDKGGGGWCGSFALTKREGC